MKRKRIERKLRSKFADWLSTIDDVDVRKAIAGDAIITGGAIASMLLNENVNDYDVYFKTAKTAKLVAQYYVKKFLVGNNIDPKQNDKIGAIKVEVDDDAKRVRVLIRSAGVISETSNLADYGYFETRTDDDTMEYIDTVMAWKDDVEERLDRESGDDKPKYRPVYITSNAITLSDDIQIVLRFTGTPKEIHDNFDFVHATSYWLASTGNLSLRKDAMEKLLAKELHYVGSKYPVCSLFRLRKFLNRGWTITAGQILKIALQISDLDLYDTAVLEDQLIGVDVAYFQEVITRIKSKYGDDEVGKKIDRAYLIQIIDETF